LDFKEISKDEKIAALGVGTWRMGGGETPDHSNDEKEIASIRRGIDLGMTHIDTAEYYGAGHTEEIVGKAISPYNRKNLFITTKVWHNHLRYNELVNSMKASLRRLQLDYVDLYLVHWPNPKVPLKETMNALEYCVSQRYTRYIGVSNFPLNLLEESQSLLKENKLVANQVKYNLIDQEPNQTLLPFCQENDITLVAYTPLAKGALARPGNPVLDGLCQKYMKTQAQISLNWLLSQKNVITIPKASSEKHLLDNIGAVGWKMAKDDVNKLSQSFK
jgi:diketogulonate reductase-like aldo/keto reductase